MNQNRTILIVDDRSVGREALQALLLGEGYNLSFACNGKEALTKARELSPDLILLDVMMPEMDGFEVCQRLRADPLLAEVPVIMVTALDDRDSLLQGIEAGADDFVTKPFDRLELRTRVQNILRLDRYRRLLSERSKFEWVVEQADDGYLIVNDRDQILYANPRACLYLGLPEDQGHSITEPFLALARKQYQCEPQEIWNQWPKLAAQKVSPYLVRPATSNANVFWLQVDLVEMYNSGDQQYLVRLREVTASVIEQRSTWTFHGQISHKLRTPLNQLVVSVDALSEEDLSALNPELRTFLSIAHKGALRLKNEIQAILEYVDTPDLLGSGQDFCSLAEISAITAEVKAELDLSPIDISYQEFDDPVKAYVPLSRQTLELILWELCENAKKFHPQQAPTIQINVTGSSDEARIQVCDDGLRLAPDQLAKIWTPYYQAEKYFTGEVSGTGLGLAMVASMIWGVGGSCRAFNRSDRVGLVVELVLPIEKA